MIGYILAIILAFTHLPSTDKRIVEMLQENGVESKLIEHGVAIYMPTLKFKLGSYYVDEKGRNIVIGAIEVLKLNSVRSRGLYIEGHTDVSGNEKFNYYLGLKRAEEVKKIFVDEGMSSTRIEINSQGSKIPMSDKHSDNRRVDVLIITAKNLNKKFKR